MSRIWYPVNKRNCFYPQLKGEVIDIEHSVYDGRKSLVIDANFIINEGGEEEHGVYRILSYDFVDDFINDFNVSVGDYVKVLCRGEEDYELSKWSNSGRGGWINKFKPVL